MSQLPLGSDTHQDADPEGFRGPEVCKIVGVSYRQLDYWTRTNLIRASVAEARGSGTQRLYSYRDLVEVKVIKNLLDGGVALRQARRAVEYLREHLGEELSSVSLVIAGNNSVLAHTDGEIVDLVRRGQGVLNIMPLASLKAELDAKIHEFVPRASQNAGDPHDSRPVPSTPAEAEVRATGGG
ncbi:MAG TPA: MerR family transcriptional regulator [Acidimicrobiia bacterium]|nr:MerR family transcriptional regulator [Acidimicrobiia bacterium]